MTNKSGASLEVRQETPGKNEHAAESPHQLYFSTTQPESQVLTVAEMFRLRDALVNLECRIREIRQGFEVELAAALGGER